MLSIKKQSLVDMVYHKLRESIIQLQLPLGSKLNVNELQARMGVSCTPIREAINRLQQEGLVVYENNVGAHIISLAPHDVLEIQQLAMTLHAAAIHLAMVNGDRATIVAELRKQLEDYLKRDGWTRDKRLKVIALRWRYLQPYDTKVPEQVPEIDGEREPLPG